jgi:flagellar motor switch protein FliM
LPRPVIQALERACHTFAQNSSAALSTELRALVRVRSVAVSQLTYNQYAQTAPDPTIAAIFKLSPWPGRGLLELDTSLGLHFVERMLGGRGEGIPEVRALTVVEKAVLEGPLMRLLTELKKACEQLTRFQPELIGLADSVRAAALVKTEEMMMVAGFELQVAAVKGSMAIVLPANLLRVGGTVEAAETGRSTNEGALREKLAASLRPLPATCVVRLGRASISAAELVALAEGDVLPLDRAAGSEMEMLVAGRPRFRCMAMRSGGRLAVKIVEGI